MRNQFFCSPPVPGWQEYRHRTTRHPRRSRSGPDAWLLWTDPRFADSLALRPLRHRCLIQSTG